MELKIEYVPIRDIKPYKRNAKLHPTEQIEQIKKSITDYGFDDPIAVWNNTIIEGHGRLIAALELGIETVPIIRLDHLTDEQRRAYALVHNKLTMNSGFDIELLNMELAELKSFDIDMEPFGFDIEEAPEEKKDMQEDDYSADPPAVPKSKVGDIYQLGNHRLICGDSTDAETINKLMDGAEADLLLTDPPYNCNVGNCERPNSSHNGEHIMNDSMPESVFIEFLTKALRNGADHMKAGAAYYVWYAGLHHIEFEGAIRNIPEFKIHEQLVWVKSHFVMGRNSDYQWMHELCLYGWKTGAAHYFIDSRSEATVIEDATAKLSTLKKGELIALCEKMMGITKSTTILRADKPNSADLHPTVKPQVLLGYQIKNSSKGGWNVLDLFGGSGSTLIACEQLGRNCFICELDPKYADVIIDRWETFTGKKAVKLNE